MLGQNSARELRVDETPLRVERIQLGFVVLVVYSMLQYPIVDGPLQNAVQTIDDDETRRYISAAF